MTATQSSFQHRFPNVSAQFNYPLAPITYFKIGGPAEIFVEADSKELIQSIQEFCASESVPFTLLGGASNVIVADKGLLGVVLKINMSRVIDTGATSDDLHLVHAEAGVRTALLVSQTVQMGYTGLEYFLGVPGTLGGAVYNNAHYLQDLIGQHIRRVEILDETCQFRWLAQEECEFGYDSSRFHHTRETIVTVEFALSQGDPQVSKDLIRKATQYRAQTQPLGIASSGCIFQNTPNTPDLKTRFPEMSDRAFVPGGFLIDQAGLKGTKIGGVEVSSKHAAWMINNGTGTAQDVKELIKLVKQTVYEKFGVELQEEVFYLESKEN